MTDREACIVLNMISGIGPARMSALCGLCGSPSGIFSLSKKELCSIQGIGESLAGKIVNWRDSVNLDAELELAERGGVRIIVQDDPIYPPLLKEIHDAPICLYVRGELPVTDKASIAVVGSRRMTAYGRKMAQHLAESASFSGWTVVSGLAYGVDAVAHQAALDAGGKTVAVLGGGLARVQPQDHIPLAIAIAENGTVISEFPMEFPPNRHSFPMRNRIISGLSRATLVIEAGIGSGALITAAAAVEQGRTVFAVPGQADNPQAGGCNMLIRQGARLTEKFEDILEEFDFLPGVGGPMCVREESADEEEGDSILSTDDKTILSELGRAEMTLEAIGEATGLPASDLLAKLMKLEILRKVKKSPSATYMAR